MKRTDLPQCMYLKHGAYYLVKQNKWTPLGRDYPQAMAEYARMTTASKSENEVAYIVRLTLDEKAKDLAANTIKQYRLCEDKIATAFQNFRVSQVKPRDIMEFMQFHADTPNMANRMLSVLRMSFNKAVIMEMCNSNPTLSIKRFSENKRDVLMTNDQFNALKDYPNPILGVIMDLCYLTAQRIGDVLKIKVTDIGDEGITILQQKTKTLICVANQPALTEVVNRAKALHPRYLSPIYLLAQNNGRIRSYSATKDMFDRSRQLSGVSGVTIHDIRAKALTDADKIGLNATKLAGHHNESQTKSYLRDKSPQIVIGLADNVKKS